MDSLAGAPAAGARAARPAVGVRQRLLVEFSCLNPWAAKDLPARLLAIQVAKLLNCSTDDVAILVSAGKLRALGKPKPNAVKFFSSIELISLLADAEWLDEATKTISQYWRRKNARRNGLIIENQPNAAALIR
jgi:hypothetical protein